MAAQSAANAPKRHRGGGPKNGKTRRVAYNTHVKKFRDEEFYKRKRTLNKYKRFQKYEEKQTDLEGASAATVTKSLFEELTSRGADALADDYEKRMQLSFAGGDEVEAPAAKRRKGKKRKAAAEDEAPIEEEPAVVAPKKKKKKCNAESTDPDEAAAPVADALSAKKPSEARSSKMKKDDGKNGKGDGKAKGKGQSSSKEAPARYRRQMREYEEAQEAKRKKWEDKQAEILAHKRRRKESAKDRALKGQRLAQRNERGQPKMTSVLDQITAQLTGGKGFGGGSSSGSAHSQNAARKHQGGRNR